MALLINRDENTVEYSNKYGQATIKFESEEMKISKMPRSNSEEIKPFLYSIDKLEELVLITDNTRMQVSFTSTLTHGFVIYHTSPSTGYICSIEKINYKNQSGKTPAEELNSLF